MVLPTCLDVIQITLVPTADSVLVKAEWAIQGIAPVRGFEFLTLLFNTWWLLDTPCARIHLGPLEKLTFGEQDFGNQPQGTTAGLTLQCLALKTAIGLNRSH